MICFGLFVVQVNYLKHGLFEIICVWIIEIICVVEYLRLFVDYLLILVVDYLCIIWNRDSGIIRDYLKQGLFEIILRMDYFGLLGNHLWIICLDYLFGLLGIICASEQGQGPTWRQPGGARLIGPRNCQWTATVPRRLWPSLLTAGHAKA